MRFWAGFFETDMATPKFLYRLFKLENNYFNGHDFFEKGGCVTLAIE